MKQRRRIRFGLLVFLLGTAPVPGAEAAPLTPSDAAGTWWAQVLQRGPDVQWMRGPVEIEESGYAYGTLETSSGASNDVDGVLVFDLDGSVRIREGTTFLGAIRPEADVIVARDTDGGYETLYGMARLDTGHCFQSDLAGDWALYGLEVDAGQAWWMRGRVNVDLFGNMSGWTENSDGGGDLLSGTISIDPDGFLTVDVDPSWRGGLAAGRDVIFGLGYETGSALFHVMVRLTPPYDIAGLAERYAIRGMIASPTDTFWMQGSTFIGHTGALVVAIDYSDGAQVTDSGQIQYQPDGTIAMEGEDAWEAAACPSRSFWAGISGEEEVELFTLLRKPPEAFRLISTRRFACGDPLIEFTWTSNRAEVYVVEWTVGYPHAGETWTTIEEAIYGNDDRTTWAIPEPFFAPARYRIRSIEP